MKCPVCLKNGFRLHQVVGKIADVTLKGAGGIMDQNTSFKHHRASQISVGSQRESRSQGDLIQTGVY